MGEVNIDEFFCPNEACQDYGKKGKGNISAQLRSCGSGVGGVEWNRMPHILRRGRSTLWVQLLYFLCNPA